MERATAIHEIATVITELPLARPIRVAIDGRDGAGKTILADEFIQPLRSRGREVIRASVDGFHNPRALRYLKGRYSPEGYFRDSFNYDALREFILEPLGPDGLRDYRVAAFDWRTDAPAISPLRRASETAILLFDGIFALRPELIEHWDFTIYVNVSVDVALNRCAIRDGSSAAPHSELNRRYIGAHELYVRECNPVALADVVFGNNNLSDPELTWQAS
jgi:uridine kinase